MKLALPGVVVKLEAHPQYLVIRQWGRLASVDDAKRMQAFVSARATELGLDRGLWDNRATEAPSREVVLAMRRWLAGSGLFKKTALLLESAPHALSISVGALNARSELRALTSEQLAEQWLTTSDEWPAREVVVFTFGEHYYAIETAATVEVMDYPQVTRMPLDCDVIAGVAVRRDRLVTVLATPTGASPVDGVAPERLLVCITREGELGIPAVQTLAVARIQAPAEPRHDTSWRTGIGDLTYLDPEQVLDHVTRLVA